MTTITIDLPDEAAAIAEKHAKELGYESAADWAFELLRNYAATREDALYTRMHPGEHNQVFGRSRRELRDVVARDHAEAIEMDLALTDAQAKAAPPATA
jgi:hypothetical protein